MISEKRAARVAYNATYRRNNRDAIVRSQAAWRKKNRPRLLLAKRAWYRLNVGKIREQRLIRERGISIERRDAMLSAQGGVCKICLLPPRRVTVDHDHATGALRGILCATCNSAIGMLNDDPAVASRAARYLRGAL